MPVVLGVRAGVGLAVLGEALDSIAEGFSSLNDSVRSRLLLQVLRLAGASLSNLNSRPCPVIPAEPDLQLSNSSLTHTTGAQPAPGPFLGSLGGLLCLYRCKQGVLQPARPSDAVRTWFLQQVPVAECSLCTTQSSAELVVSRDKRRTTAERCAGRSIRQCGNTASLG